MGVEITQGIIKVEALVADSVQTNTLEVGTSDAPTGITIYDRATGQPVCVFSENNVLQESGGKCQPMLKPLSYLPRESDPKPKLRPRLILAKLPDPSPADISASPHLLLHNPSVRRHIYADCRSHNRFI